MTNLYARYAIERVQAQSSSVSIAQKDVFALSCIRLMLGVLWIARHGYSACVISEPACIPIPATVKRGDNGAKCWRLFNDGFCCQPLNACDCVTAPHITLKSLTLGRLTRPLRVMYACACSHHDQISRCLRQSLEEALTTPCFSLYTS